MLTLYVPQTSWLQHSANHDCNLSAASDSCCSLQTCCSPSGPSNPITPRSKLQTGTLQCTRILTLAITGTANMHVNYQGSYIHILAFSSFVSTQVPISRELNRTLWDSLIEECNFTLTYLVKHEMLLWCSSVLRSAALCYWLPGVFLLSASLAEEHSKVFRSHGSDKFDIGIFLPCNWMFHTFLSLRTKHTAYSIDNPLCCCW